MLKATHLLPHDLLARMFFEQVNHPIGYIVCSGRNPVLSRSPILTPQTRPSLVQNRRPGVDPIAQMRSIRRRATQTQPRHRLFNPLNQLQMFRLKSRLYEG